jgi:hypothetical protein
MEVSGLSAAQRCPTDVLDIVFDEIALDLPSVAFTTESAVNFSTAESANNAVWSDLIRVCRQWQLPALRRLYRNLCVSAPKQPCLLLDRCRRHLKATDHLRIAWNRQVCPVLSEFFYALYD